MSFLKSSRRCLAPLLAVALVSVWCAPHVGAQVMRVELRDSVTAAPVSGVLVTALDSAGARRADGLSGDGGVVTLRLPVAGTYTITIRRIGVRPRQVPGVVVEAGGTRTLALSVASVQQLLARVQVTARNTCGRAPDGDDRIGALWEQVSLALRAATITQREGVALPPLRVIERTNELSPMLEERGTVVTRDAQGAGRLVQADDPDSLATLGYVRRDDDGSMSYFAPDEQVLLSDAFLATHCFSTPKRDRNALLAELRFQPIRGRRVADVEGTAFVDVNTGELRQIAYRYVASRQLLPIYAEHAGGDVFLRRLPNGAWIVSKWSIRMPVFGRSIAGGQVIVTGYREAAGLVQDVRRNVPVPQPPDR
jgi:hypothetical protein